MLIEIAGGEGLNHESRELVKRSKELDEAIVSVREDVEDVKDEVEDITTDGLDISKAYSGYSQQGTHADTSHYERNTRTGTSYTNDVGASGMRMTESPLPYSAEYETQDFELTFATTNKLKGSAKEGMVTTGDYKVVDSAGNVTASLTELNNQIDKLNNDLVSKNLEYIHDSTFASLASVVKSNTFKMFTFNNMTDNPTNISFGLCIAFRNGIFSSGTFFMVFNHTGSACFLKT